MLLFTSCDDSEGKDVSVISFETVKKEKTHLIMDMVHEEEYGMMNGYHL